MFNTRLKIKSVPYVEYPTASLIFTCKDLIVFIKIAFKLNAQICRVIHFKNQNVIFFKSVT